MSKSRAPKPTDRRELRRVIAGVRVVFVFDHKKLNVEIQPNEDDLVSADTISTLRLWATVGAWAADVARNNPGWKIDGEVPHADPLDEPDPDEAEHGEEEGTGAGGGDDPGPGGAAG